MVNSEISKIKEIVKIIDENIIEPLERSQVEKLFKLITDGFEALFIDANVSYKPVIQSKAQGIKVIINKNINETPRWMETQSNFNQIKDILTGLGNEIVLLEQSLASPTTTTVQTTETIQTTQRPTFTESVAGHEKSNLEMAKVGAEAFKDIPLVGKATGASIGAGLAAASTFTTGLGQLWDNVQTDVRNTYNKTLQTGADAYKNTIEAAKETTKEALKEGIQAKGLWGTEIKFGGSTAVAAAEVDGLKKELAGKDAQIADLKEQIAFLKGLLKK